MRSLLRSSLSLRPSLLSSLALLALVRCGGDVTVASMDVTWVSYADGARVGGAVDAFGDFGAPGPNADVRIQWDDVNHTKDLGPGKDVPVGPIDIEAPDTTVAPKDDGPKDTGGPKDAGTKKDAGSKKDAGPQDPPWLDVSDPVVKGCLEAFPAICDKVSECGSTQPILGLIGGFCPTLMSALSPVLTAGCEQVATALQSALPDVQIPLVGDLAPLVEKLIVGCIENFNCDPQYLQDIGAKFFQLIQVVGGAGGGGGGGLGGLGDALPALLELAQMCGGLENLLPFGGFLPF